MFPSTVVRWMLIVVCAAWTLSAAAAEYVVDPVRGADGNAGTVEAPLRTVAAGVAKLQPGDTLLLRGGAYLDHVDIQGLAGTAEAPIVIASFPGEVAVIDGGLPQFRAVGNEDWEPVADGAPDEWRSAMVVPAGGYVGQFLDTEARLLRYSNANDFRATNELGGYGVGVSDDDPSPGAQTVHRKTGVASGMRIPWVYFGPGIYFNAATSRLHIRLSRTHVRRLIREYYQGQDDPRRPADRRLIARQTEVEDYEGPTDPRQVPLTIAPNRVTLTVQKCAHVIFRDLVVRHSVQLGGNRDVTFQDVVFHVAKDFGDFGRDQRVKFLHCEFNGGLPGWVFRGDFKGPYAYRDPDGSIIVNDKVRWTNRTLLTNYGTRDLEVAYCEFRNGHDLYLAGVNTDFHHNLVEDIHDDALFVSYPDEIENLRIRQNVVRRVLMGMAYHGDRAGVSRFVYRNLIDMREPIRSSRPRLPGERANWVWRSLFIAKTGQIGPLSVYQNTFLIRNNETIMGGLAFPNPDNPRRIFNNLFLSLNPALPIVSRMPPQYPAQIDGNLWWRWGERGEAPLIAGFHTLDDYRSSPDFDASRSHYRPGWFAHDLHTNPLLVRWQGQARPDDDLRLSARSPARGAGVVLPDVLEDPLRPTEGARPDIGAFPFGAEPLRVGRHGRFSFPDEEANRGSLAQRPAPSATDVAEPDDGESGQSPVSALMWTGSAGDERWGNPDNWSDGQAPREPEHRLIQLDLPAPRRIVLDRDQSLRAGLTSSGFRGTVELDLAGHELAVRAGTLQLAGARNATTIHSGRVTLGDSAVSANLRAFEQAGSGEAATLRDVELALVQVGELTVGQAAENRSARGTLDLSRATLAHHTLRAGRLVLGRYQGMTAGTSGVGTLLLPPSVRAVSVQEMVLGHNLRIGGPAMLSVASGALDLAQAPHVQLTITRLLYLAVGDHTQAHWNGLPARMDVTIGQPATPAVVRIGFNNRRQGDETSPDTHVAQCRLVLPAGTFRGLLRELRVGHSLWEPGRSDATLDLSQVTLATLEIVGEAQPETYYRQDLTRTTLYRDVRQMLEAPIVTPGLLLVGVGPGASGRLVLPTGSVSAGTVIVGDDAPGSNGVLELRGTTLTARRHLWIGAGGKVVCQPAADGRSLTLESDAEDALEIAGELCVSAPVQPAVVLRVRGERTATLEQLLDSGRIRVIDADSSRLTLGRDGPYTTVRVAPGR